jgi:hypothetical protein
MRRFLNGTQEAWDDLSQRARRACVVFGGCQLPPGCQPSTARIGFEIHRSEAILFIDKGIRNHGSSRALSAWLRRGEMRFAGIGDLSGGQPTVRIAANPAPICIPADYELAVPGNLAISLFARS